MRTIEMTRKIVKTGASLLLALALAVSGLWTATVANAEDSVQMTAVYKAEGINVQGVEFHLYKVGTVDNGEFKLDSPYSASGVSMDFSKDTAQADLMTSADNLFDYIKTHSLESSFEQKAKPDAEGNMEFNVEKRVLYLLASSEEQEVGDKIYSARPMYMWYIEGNKEKVTVKPQSKKKPDESVPAEYTVVKHWSGDSTKSRPDSVEVELYEDGKLKETVELNSDNDWTYSWTDKDGKGKWTCVEKNVPKGYSCSVKTAEDGTKFIVTNKIPPKDGTPGNPSKPRTGDPTTLRWSIVALGVSGIALLLAAFRRRREE